MPFGWPEGFDVSADGEWFVVATEAEQTDEAAEGRQGGIVFVENWVQEFAAD